MSVVGAAPESVGLRPGLLPCPHETSLLLSCGYKCSLSPRPAWPAFPAFTTSPVTQLLVCPRLQLGHSLLRRVLPRSQTLSRAPGIGSSPLLRPPTPQFVMFSGGSRLLRATGFEELPWILGLSPSLKHLPGLPGSSHPRPTGCTNGGWASGLDPLPIGMGARGEDPWHLAHPWLPT